MSKKIKQRGNIKLQTTLLMVIDSVTFKEGMNGWQIKYTDTNFAFG